MNIKILKNKHVTDFKSWPIWTCEESEFDWEYNQEEHCFILEGSVTIIEAETTVKISQGDYVIFPKGLKCVWKVTQAIRKHYIFK